MTAPALHFHHVGVACRDIEAEASRWLGLGYAREGGAFEDPRQGVRGLFLSGQSPRLELLEAIEEGDGGVLGPWLAADIKLYHLAYETDSLSDAIAHMRAQGAKVVVPPVPAVAFCGREIAFVMLPNRMLIELIDREKV